MDEVYGIFIRMFSLTFHIINIMKKNGDGPKVVIGMVFSKLFTFI